jgi:hypothetical protein
MKSEPITWRIISPVSCMACGIRPSSRTVTLRVHPQVEINPLLCLQCCEKTEEEIKEALL